MRIVFLRHGESAYNLLGRCNADPAIPVPLTVDGRRQANAAAQRLCDLDIQRVYVSRLQRAQETAAIVNMPHCAELFVDARLDDRNTGFEGLPVADYMHAMQSAPDPYRWKTAGGESYLDMVARVHAFLADLAELAATEASMVLVVTHHEVLQAVTGYFRNLEPAQMWQIWVDNCEALVFETC